MILSLAEIYLAERAPDLAMEQLTAVLERDPQNYRAYLLKGNASVLKRDLKGARQAYLRATELSPGSPAAYYQLATLDRLERRYDQALSNLNKVLEAKPDHVFAMAAISSVYMAQNQPAKALSFLDEKLKENENNNRLAAVLHELRGGVLLAQENYTESETAFKKAIDLNPDLVGPYFALARIYQVKNETEKAISQYQKILEKQPKFIQAQMALGAIYEAEGKVTEARNMYEKVLQINPDFAPASNNLAWILLQEGNDPDQALALAKRAKAQLPDDPRVADTLGLAYIVKGLHASAINELSDAAGKLPEDPKVHYHLGLAYWKNGEREAAIEALENALNLGETFPEREEAERLLEEIRTERT